jgi:hypothetical protein
MINSGIKILIGFKLMVYSVFKGFKGRKATDKDSFGRYNLLTNEF